MTNKYFMMDLFAGCGGLSTGLEFSGFKPCLFSEIDEAPFNSYLSNRSSQVGNYDFKELDNLHIKDILEFDSKKVNEIIELLNKLEPSLHLKKNTNSNLDLITGGPPCQGFSGIGHRR